MSTPAAPTLVSIVCITPVPDAALNVSWIPSGDYDGPYTIVVQDSAGNSMGSSLVASGNGGSWGAATAMVPGGTYSLIVNTSDPNISTASVPVLVTVPQSVATRFDGETVLVTWTNAPGLGAPDVQLRLRGDVNAQVLPPVANYNVASAVPDPAPFPPGQRLWAQVAAVTGIATGPFSPPTPVLQTRPAVSSISTAVSGATATVTLTTPADPGFSAGQPFAVTLYADDQPFANWPSIPSTNAADGSFQIAVPMAAPAWPLPAGTRFRFALRQSNTKSLGPGGLRQLYPAGAPAIRAFSYQFGATSAADQVLVSIYPPAGEAAASGVFAALVAPNGAIKASGKANGFTVALTVDRTAAAGCSVTAATMIGGAAGPSAIASDPLLQAMPAIETVAFDGRSVTVEWTPLTGVTTYSVAVLGSAGILATMLSGGPQATLAVPASATGVTVTAVAGLSTGPASGSVALISLAPSPTDVAFAAGTATVSFGGVGGTQMLNYQVYDGAKSVAAGSLPAGNGDVVIDSATLLLGSELSVRARLSVVAAGDAPASSGPWSDAVALVTQSPAAVAVAFDGRTALVSWQASSSRRVTGYRAGIYQGASLVGSEAATSGSSVAIDCSSLPAADNYQVIVTPMAGSIAGAPAAPVPLFAAGLYLSADTATSPHIVPASLMSRPNTDINIFLPDIFTVAPGSLPAASMFGLRVATPAEQPFAYVLSIPAAGGAWSFAQDPIRPAVNAAVVALLGWLDSNNVSGYGLQLVSEAIGRALPQSFAETLLYGAGLNSGSGFIDLRPGHVLQVEFETYQYQGVADAYLNGFVGGASCSYEIRSEFDPNGRWLIGFDAFLGQMSAFMTVAKPFTTGASSQAGAGPADLYFTGFRQPYCRLVYPASFLGLGNDKQAGRGAPQPYYNLALLAASSLAALDAATAKLRQQSVDIGSAALLYFRGRTVMTVSHAIELDGRTQLVPVGTTVGNLLEGLGRRPLRGTLPLTGISLERAVGPVVGAVPAAGAGVDVAGSMPVRLDWNPVPARPATGPEWLDLPLLAGDRISLGALENPAR
ncbi:MAG TPA: hypothetical protein VGB79_03055 [Allosphingosinicella sp.]|jgi:hypothetical protein